MLQNIRDKTQGWILWVIILILAFAFSLWGIQYYLEVRHHKEVAIKINKQSITQKQIDGVYQRLLRQKQAQLGSHFAMTRILETQLKAQAIRQTVIKQVLSDAAYHENFRISPQQIDMFIQQMPAFQQDGEFSINRFKSILSSLLYSEQEFFATIRTSLLINQVHVGITATSFVLPNEINDAFKLIDQRRSIAYLIIPRKRYLDNIKFADEALKKYYQQNITAFMKPEQVSVKYLLLSVNELKKKISLTSKELHDYYQSNIDNFSTPKRWQIKRIMFAKKPNQQQLNKAATTAFKQANEHWVTTTELGPQLTQTINELQVGELSQPIKTTKGYEVLKVLAVEPTRRIPFAKVADKVKQALAEQKAEQMFADQSDQLANLTFSNPNSLKPAAKALGLTIYTTGLFTRKGNTEALTKNQKVLTTAFSDNILKQKNNSDMLTLAPGTVVVLRIKQHIVAKPKVFAEVKKQILTKLKNKQAQADTQKFGKHIIALLRTGKDRQAIAKQFQMKWQVKDKITAHADSLPQAILAAAFKLPKPKSVKHLPIAGIGLPNGYAVVEVFAVDDGNIEPKQSAAYQAFKAEMENSLGEYTYELYVRGAVQQAKIKPKSIKEKVHL